ncbi:MAG TPA: YafY family protein, partial [Ilumatobacteraceae bacterium]
MRTVQVRNACKYCDIDTPARLLRLLALMSSRATWRGDELAARLEITERSVRRDMTRLRDLGYPIESITGPYGGYSLGAGGRLPPLLLNDDEAVSIAVALHQIAHRSTASVADGALSALTKLSQVMPGSLRERVAALTSVVVDIGSAAARPTTPTGTIDSLMALAVTCSRSERTRFDYRSGEGAETTRHVEPFRLVSAGNRWYLVAFDLDRSDWRSFRVDRVSRIRTTGARFQRGEVPDAAEFVAAGLAVHAYAQRALIRIKAPLHDAIAEIPPTIGVARADPDDAAQTLVEIGGDHDWVARFLVSLALPYEVVEPAELRAEL